MFTPFHSIYHSSRVTSPPPSPAISSPLQPYCSHSIFVLLFVHIYVHRSQIGNAAEVCMRVVLMETMSRLTSSVTSSHTHTAHDYDSMAGSSDTSEYILHRVRIYLQWASLVIAGFFPQLNCYGDSLKRYIKLSVRALRIFQIFNQLIVAIFESLTDWVTRWILFFLRPIILNQYFVYMHKSFLIWSHTVSSFYLLLWNMSLLQ
jgi:hypothetical protein